MTAVFHLISNTPDPDEQALRGIMSLYGLSYSPDLLRALQAALELGKRSKYPENPGELR